MKTERLYIIGDTHNPKNYFRVINMLDEMAEDNEEIFTIQLGDMGIGFVGNVFPKTWNTNHVFIRGNHDDPAKASAHTNYLGDFGYIEKWDLFYMGGAYTPDYAEQRTGANFFPDEELDYSLMMKAYDLYNKVRPRFVVTHDAPHNIVQLIHPYVIQNKTIQILENMLRIHQPTTWFFGHHHVYGEYRYGPTNLICVPMNQYIEVNL